MNAAERAELVEQYARGYDLLAEALAEMPHGGLGLQAGAA